MAKQSKKPDRDRLYQLYVTFDLTKKEIAGMYGVKEATVNNWLNLDDIHKYQPRQIQPKPDTDEIRKLYVGEGKTAKEIAEIYDVSPSTARSWTVGMCKYGRIPEEIKDPELLHRLYIEENHTLVETAQILGISLAALKILLLKAGIRKDGKNTRSKYPGREKMLELTEMAGSVQDIAEIYGVTKETVYVWCDKAEIPGFGRKKHVKPPEPEELKRLYIDERRPATAIAEMYGVNPPVARKWVRKAGLSGMRPRMSEIQKASPKPRKPRKVSSPKRSESCILDPEEVRKLYSEQNLSVSKIAEMYGVSTSAVRRVVIANNIRKNKPDEAELRRMFTEENRSVQEIAEQYSVCTATVCNWMKKYGIKKEEG